MAFYGKYSDEDRLLCIQAFASLYGFGKLQQRTDHR